MGKRNGKTGRWDDVGDGRAREKTSQALREQAPVIRKQQEEEQGEGKTREDVSEKSRFVADDDSSLGSVAVAPSIGHGVEGPNQQQFPADDYGTILSGELGREVPNGTLESWNAATNPTRTQQQPAHSGGTFVRRGFLPPFHHGSPNKGSGTGEGQ